MTLLLTDVETAFVALVVEVFALAGLLWVLTCCDRRKP